MWLLVFLQTKEDMLGCFKTIHSYIFFPNCLFHSKIEAGTAGADMPRSFCLHKLQSISCCGITMLLSGQLGIIIPQAELGMPIRPLKGPAEESFFAKSQFNVPLISFNVESFLLDFQTLCLILKRNRGYIQFSVLYWLVLLVL